MKRLGLVLCFLLLAGFSPAMQEVIFSKNINNIAPYTGPGDVFSGAVAWFSCSRAYTATFASGGGAICDLVDTATGATSCTLKIATNGFADLTSNSCVGGTVTVTTFCTITHPAGCSVTKMYDQTGNGNHVVQATLASMPLLILSSSPTGTLPVIQSSGIVGTMQSSVNPTWNTPNTMSIVAKRSAGTSGNNQIGQSGGAQVGFAGANLAEINGSAMTKSASDGSWHSIQGLESTAGNGAINVDGSDTGGGTTGTLGIGAAALRVARVTGTSDTVLLAEAGVWNSSSTATNRNNVSANQHSISGYNF